MQQHLHSQQQASVRFVGDEDVATAIEAAAHAACHELDDVFPGGDRGGVTSEFVAALQLAMQQLLLGRSILDDVRGHAVVLQTLALDDTFFGPRVEGEAFLITVAGHLALAPGRATVCLLAQAPDAWASFDAALSAARKYLQGHASTIDEANRFRLRIEAVELGESGYKLAADSPSAAA